MVSRIFLHANPGVELPPPPCRAYPPACSIVIAALALMHSRFSPFRDGTVQHRIINVASMNAAGDRIYD